MQTFPVAFGIFTVKTSRAFNLRSSVKRKRPSNRNNIQVKKKNLFTVRIFCNISYYICIFLGNNSKHQNVLLEKWYIFNLMNEDRMRIAIWKIFGASFYWSRYSPVGKIDCIFTLYTRALVRVNTEACLHVHTYVHKTACTFFFLPLIPHF